MKANDFDKIARWYDFLIKLTLLGKEKKLREKLIMHIPKNVKNILELACGTGSNLLLIKKRFPKARVYGVDKNKEMLDIAKKKAREEGINIKVYKKDMIKTRLKSKYFDVVILSLALHEVDNVARTKVLAEAKRVLKKNGRLLILDIARPKGILGYFMDLFVMFFEPYGKEFIKLNLKEFIEENGFKVVKLEKLMKGFILFLECKIV